MSFWDIVWFIFISFPFVAYLMVMFSIIGRRAEDQGAGLTLARPPGPRSTSWALIGGTRRRSVGVIGGVLVHAEEQTAATLRAGPPGTNAAEMPTTWMHTDRSAWTGIPRREGAQRPDGAPVTRNGRGRSAAGRSCVTSSHPPWMRSVDPRGGKVDGDDPAREKTMTADVSSSHPGVPAAGYSAAARTGIAVLGGAAVVIGIVLMFNPVAATRTLGLLLGLALVVTGCLEIAVDWDSGRRARGLLLGGVLVVGGLLAAFWPGVTVWTLAVLTGLSLLVHGVVRVFGAFADRAELPGWGWLALAGAFNVVVGIVVLTWPEATVRVLCLVLGAQVVVFGLLLLIRAFVGSRRDAPAPGQA
jgi:uncharacterized membrane protein HdeD (DUF308 family)